MVTNLEESRNITTRQLLPPCFSSEERGLCRPSSEFECLMMDGLIGARCSADKCRAVFGRVGQCNRSFLIDGSLPLPAHTCRAGYVTHTHLPPWFGAWCDRERGKRNGPSIKRDLELADGCSRLATGVSHHLGPVVANATGYASLLRTTHPFPRVARSVRDRRPMLMATPVC